MSASTLYVLRVSLIVLEVASLAEARAWAAADPYAKAGLFEEVRIQEWKKVIG